MSNNLPWSEWFCPWVVMETNLPIYRHCTNKLLPGPRLPQQTTFSVQLLESERCTLKRAASTSDSRGKTVRARRRLGKSLAGHNLAKKVALLFSPPFCLFWVLTSLVPCLQILLSSLWPFVYVSTCFSGLVWSLVSCLWSLANAHTVLCQLALITFL